MPVYFIHGFRWPRPAIRIHIILHNLEDAAAEWLVAPGTTREMLDNFNELYPESMEHLPHLRFVEQYDPNDTTAGSGSQPYAYVADVVEEVKLGVDVDEIRGKGVPNDQWASMMELRDKLAPEEKVAWYIVVCGDEERWAPTASELEEQEEVARVTTYPYREPERESRRPQTQRSVTPRSAVSSQGQQSQAPQPQQPQQPQNSSPQQEEQPRGIRKLFSSVARRKSRSRVRDSPPPKTSTEPLPPNNIKLKTSNLAPAESAPNGGDRSAPSGGSAHSWEADDAHEVITGPTTYEDDPLAAPSPTVRHGPEADIAIRNKRLSKYSVYPNPYTSTIRTVGPDVARALSPQGRNGNGNGNVNGNANGSGNSTGTPSIVTDSANPSRRQSINFSRNPSPQTLSPPGTVTPAIYKPSTGSSSGVSTPATYHTANTRAHRVSPLESYPPSLNASRQSLAQPPSARQSFSQPTPSSNVSRQSLILPNHQQQQQQHPHQRFTNPQNMSHASLLSQASRQGPDAGKRASQATMSGMSPTVQALYGQHERDWRQRQSVRQDELVAKGLDEGVFTELR